MIVWGSGSNSSLICSKSSYDKNWDSLTFFQAMRKFPDFLWTIQSLQQFPDIIFFSDFWGLLIEFFLYILLQRLNPHSWSNSVHITLYFKSIEYKGWPFFYYIISFFCLPMKLRTVTISCRNRLVDMENFWKFSFPST